MLQEKQVYTIQELFVHLPITLKELSSRSGINEVTLARIRDGGNTYTSTANKLLIAFADVYKQPFYLGVNVTGINVLSSRRGKKKSENDAA